MSLFSDLRERVAPRRPAEDAVADERAGRTVDDGRGGDGTGGSPEDERPAAPADRGPAVERAPHVDRTVDDRATDDDALGVGPTEWEERQRAREAEYHRERVERVEREERRRGLIVVASAIILIALLVLFVNVRGGSDPGVDPAPRAADQPPVDVPAEMPVVDVVTPVSQLAFADRAAADVRDAPPRDARPGAVRPPARPQVRVVLDADVLFPKDSPVLRPLAHQRLRQLAAAIARRGPGSVLVVGYTDDLGTAQHGLVLSRRRAAAVSAVLRPVLPVAQYPFAVAGRGEASPVVPNTSEANRRKNRRVEVTHVPR